jgi:hypothetical protein
VAEIRHFKIKGRLVLKCSFIGHDYTKWTFVKKRSFMGFVELRKVRYCKRCGREDSRYVQDISYNSKEFGDVIWYHELYD